MQTDITTDTLTLEAVTEILDVTYYKYLIVNALLINQAKTIAKYIDTLIILNDDYLGDYQWYMSTVVPEKQNGRIPYYPIS